MFAMFAVLAASHKKNSVIRAYAELRYTGNLAVFSIFYRGCKHTNLSTYFRPSVRRLANYSERQSRRDDGTAKLSEN